MTRRLMRRVIFWVLLAGFAAGCGWWIFYVPYQPSQLFRGIPGNAVWVSAHDQLADRWTQVLSHPVGAALVTPLELDDDVIDDPGTHALLDLFARRDVLLAYVPELGLTGAPGWVLSGWLGGRATVLRWSGRSMEASGLIPLPTRSGWQAWLVAEPLNDEGLRLTFAIVDGMAIGCLSPDPGAIEDLLATYNGFLPSVHRRRDLAPWMDRVLDASARDRGWMMPERLGLGHGWPERIFVELDLDDPGRIHGSVYLPASLAHAGLASGEALAELASHFGGAPLAYAIAAPSLVHGGWMNMLALPAMAPLRPQLVHQPVVQSVAAAVLHDDFSGRLKGIKIPTLLLAVQPTDDVEPRAFVQEMLDQLNMSFRLGLVPRYEQVGPYEMMVIEGGAGQVYGMLNRQEQLALVTMGSWVVVGSNALGLQRWLEWSMGQGGRMGRAAEGAERLVDQDELFRLWMDLNEGSQAIRLALNAWSLKLLIDDPFGSQTARRELNEIKAWVDSLAPLEAVAAWVADTGEGEIVVHVQAGRTTTSANAMLGEPQ